MTQSMNHSDFPTISDQTSSNRPAAVKDALFAELARNRTHFKAAPVAFFTAWKRAVSLAGVSLFGDGTQQGFEQAHKKWDLCPAEQRIDAAIGGMSSGEKVFLAALVSFYNSETGGRLLQRVGVQGLADLGGLDLERRQLIADLILNYTGW